MELKNSSESNIVARTQRTHCASCYLKRIGRTKGCRIYIYTCCNCGASVQLADTNPACYACGHEFGDFRGRKHKPSLDSGDTKSTFAFIRNVTFNGAPKAPESPSREAKLPINANRAGSQVSGSSTKSQIPPFSNATDTFQSQSSSPTESESENGHSDSDRHTNSTCPTTPSSTHSQEGSPQQATLAIQEAIDRVMISAPFISVLQEYIASIRRVVNNATSEGNSARTETSTVANSASGKAGFTTNVKHSLPEDNPSNGHDEDDDDDDDDSDDSKDRGKRRRYDSAGMKRPRKLACPFFRYDPKAFADHKTCRGPGFPNISRVKEHLYRKHKLVRCDTCYKVVGSETFLTEHLAQPVACKRRKPRRLDPIDGITKDKEEKLKRKEGFKRKEGLRKMSVVENWRAIYMILFPESDPQRIPPAYRDGDFDSIEDFCKRDLRRVLKERIERVVREKILKFDQTTLDLLKGKLGPGEKLDSLLVELMDSGIDEVLCLCRGENGSFASAEYGQLMGVAAGESTIGNLKGTPAGDGALEDEPNLEDAPGRHSRVHNENLESGNTLPEADKEVSFQRPVGPPINEWIIFDQDEPPSDDVQLRCQEDDTELGPKPFALEFENWEASLTGSTLSPIFAQSEIDQDSTQLASNWSPPSLGSALQQQPYHDIIDMLDEPLDLEELAAWVHLDLMQS